MDMTLYNNIINTLCQFRSDKSHIIHIKKREKLLAPQYDMRDAFKMRQVL